MNIFNLNNKQSGNILIYTLLIIAIAIVVYLVATSDKGGPDKNGEINTENWKVFTSADYDFEVKYPPTWQVKSFPNDEIAPKFNFYKRSDEEKLNFPLTHHSQGTHFSVFPEGIPTEGVFGKTEETSLSPDEVQAVNQRNYLLGEGGIWATAMNLEERPSSWNESGFLWAQVEISDLEVECFREGEKISSNQCDPLLGDELVHNGSINEEDRAIQEAIIKSFKFIDEENGGDVAEMIQLESPQAEEKISSPLSVSGEARGQWYFEASFPVVLTNWDGKIIAEGFAEAEGDWMTEDFVPFSGELTFENPSFEGSDEDHFSKAGTLILQKANPSGLPENDAALEIPVKFE